MGTLIQRHTLGEAEFRGERFADHTHDLKGANEVLNLTQPDIIRGIHDEYLDCRCRHHQHQHLQRQRRSRWPTTRSSHSPRRSTAPQHRSRARLRMPPRPRTPAKPRFVAGSLGPTNKTASLSPDVNDPGARNVTWEELVDAYFGRGARPDRRRRRHPAHRDDLRHAQRQGGDLRGRVALRRAGSTAAGDRQRDDRRPVGPQPVGPDRGRVLEQRAPCPPVRGRAQLLARR